MNDLTDIHTHTPGRSEALLSLPPLVAMDLHNHPDEPQPYSIELHPWHLVPSTLTDFRQAVDACCDDPRWRAVGECGLDRLCDTPAALQREAFLLALHTARTSGKPVVIHCVRQWEELDRCVREVWGASGAQAAADAGLPLILHGFRKGPALALQLLRAGYAFAFGPHFHTDTVRLIPEHRLYCETDDSTTDIALIRQAVAAAKQGHHGTTDR